MSIGITFLRPLAFLAGVHAARQVRCFLASHQRTAQVQDALLRELLAAHAQSDFGKDHGFGRLRSYADFTSAVPVGSYETLRPYMQQVIQGHPAALLPPGEKVLMFSQTSGTTGQPKRIPVTRHFLAVMRRGWNIWGLMALRQHPQGWLRRILQISSSMHESTSPTGLPCGAISGLLASTQKRIVRRMYVAPPAMADICDPAAKYYTLLRCGVGKDVAIITTANPSSTIKLLETGQLHAERLIRDVRDGTCDPPGEIPREIRSRLHFRPDRRLADRLAESLARDGALLPRHFWNLAFAGNWTGGTLKLYLPRLKQLLGDVPVRDIGLLASEGRFSVPIQDGTAAGVAEITGNFLEFIPAEQCQSANPLVLRAEQVEVGREYFLVVTNWAGLWRYNMDDRVRVVGRLGQSPIIEFLSRGLHTANITGEKLTEHQVVEAMRLACQRGGATVERFVLQGHFAPMPYYELRLEAQDSACAQRIALLMEAALCELNVEYASKRSSGRLGPIRAVVLESGALERAELENIRARHARAEQYKHRYLLTELIQDV